MRASSVLALSLLATSQSALADDVAARLRFEAGVRASEEQRWQDAAEDFEASLNEADRSATRFNLVVAYHHLEQPLGVVRHALRFLAEEHGGGREQARERVATMLLEARSKVAVLDVSALPVESELRVNGYAPAVAVGRAYLLPGHQRLELWFGDVVHETMEITLTAGQELPWPRLKRPVLDTAVSREVRVDPLMASVSQKPNERVATPDGPHLVVRRRVAWTLGSVGAALAVAAGTCLLVADRRSDRLRDGGIARTQEAGYFDALGRYWSSVDAVMPLAFSGGVLMASAVIVGERIAQRGSWAWSIASLAAGAALLGAGSFWLAREPYHVIPGTEVERPSRQGGSLLFSLGIPFITYGVALPILLKRGKQLRTEGATVRLAW